ncbi:MAG: hypothetical protein HEEMFOPI_00982 [Holosporales bacterium]
MAGLLVASLAEKAFAGSTMTVNPQVLGQAVPQNKPAQPGAAVVQQPGVKAPAQVAVTPAVNAAAQATPAVASVGTQTSLPPLTPADAAKKMKGALGEPLLMKTKCAKEYGNVKWSEVKELSDRGYSTQVVAHFTKNAPVCDPVKDKNFMDNMKKSCDAAANITGFPLKDQYCGLAGTAANIKAATIKIVQDGAKDDALFPSGPLMLGFNKGVACPANAVAPLNLDELSKYYVRHFATSIDPKLIPQQQGIGISAMKRANDYLDKLQKCSANQGDKNFNAALALKFPDVNLPMRCKDEHTQATLNNAPPAFVKKIQDLCMSSKNTGTLIDAAKQVADIKKAFNVPMTPLGYVNLPESLIIPLTTPDAAEKISTWSRLDTPGFEKHFNALVDGLTQKPGKVVNPKASAMMVTACTNSLKDSKNPKVLTLCQVAQKTVQNNTAVQIKSALGANGKTFNCKAALNINAISVVNLLNANPAEGQAYIGNVSGCLQNGDAMLAAQVLTACQAGLAGVPAAADLCALATQKNAEAAAANNALGGVDPTAVAADPSAVPVDASTQTDDASVAAADLSAETFDQSTVAADLSAETFDQSTVAADLSLVEPDLNAGQETVYGETGDPLDLNVGQEPVDADGNPIG